MQLEQFTKALDEKKKISHKSGREFWMARDIQEILGYPYYEKFTNVIDKAITACQNSAPEPVEYHFHQTVKRITAGKGAQREKADFFLSRYACYLIAMNGDTSKPEISMAQSYFAIQTRRQEVSDQLALDAARLELRNQVKDHNIHLSGAAKKAGVKDFPKFQGAGYKSLYNGLTVAQIKRKKGIPDRDDLLDRAGRLELAANHLRITLTEECLQNVSGEDAATQTHYRVGSEVRKTIERARGVMPEDLKPEPHIKEVEKKLKEATKQLPAKS